MCFSVCLAGLRHDPDGNSTEHDVYVDRFVRWGSLVCRAAVSSLGCCGPCSGDLWWFAVLFFALVLIFLIIQVVLRILLPARCCPMTRCVDCCRLGWFCLVLQEKLVFFLVLQEFLARLTLQVFFLYFLTFVLAKIFGTKNCNFFGEKTFEKSFGIVVVGVRCYV